MSRVYNFSAGPGALPLPVLEQARQELVEHDGHGMSVMEMSHRSKMFEEIIGRAESDFRSLLCIPENYKVLFLQGGASLQFAMVPLNLLNGSGKADYVNTGMWSKKAIAQGKKLGEINVVASSEDKTFTYIPQLDASMFDPQADYVHITSNNTIYGTRYSQLPPVGDVPLVSDMSSCILSEVMDVSKFGVIYAGAQKNIGPAGLTIVVVREDLIGHARENTPIMLDYATHADAGSMYNTPPTYAIYMAGLSFSWLLSLGGVAAMQQINEKKAALLYDYLDESKLFSPTVQGVDRSIMNIPFVTPDAAIDAEFIQQAAKAGLVNLKGHRSVGGMRASLYNAMPYEGVVELVNFMQRFEREHV